MFSDENYCSTSVIPALIRQLSVAWWCVLIVIEKQNDFILFKFLVNVFLLLLLLLFLLNKFHARKKKKHLNSNVDWCLATFSDSSNVLENIPECRLEYLPICLHSFLKAILWIIFNVNTHNFRISYLWRFYFLKCSLFTLFFSFYRFVNKYFTF